MKKIILLLALSLSLASASVSAESKSFTSTFTESFPQNNAEIDWQDGMFPIEDGKCFIKLLNNSEGLYFQVLVKDRKTQSMFLNQGLKLYIDLNGKQKKKYSVVFPTIRPMHKRPANQQRLQDDEDGEMRPPRESFDGEKNDNDSQNNDAQAKKNMPPRDPKERAKQLTKMLASISSRPVSLYCNDEEMLLPEGSIKIATSGSNIVYSGTIAYDRLGKLGKNGKIAIGIFSEPASNDNAMPMDGPDGMTGGPGGGMMGGPGGGMMGGPGGGMMGRGPRNFQESSNKKQEKFTVWSIFETK